MTPYSDGIPARRFPIVNSTLIAIGVAFFAHVGGFVFGFLIARVLVGADRMAARDAEGTRW
ncbi:hypothetical protein A5696_21165 [Mycobacterium sp. E2699]|nr:hypothetical protein A5696_21165 [Mycobacterium sp. E2699]OBI57020.1 hypothetical protein A5705_20340 [Mycobacterium sp. E787]